MMIVVFLFLQLVLVQSTVPMTITVNTTADGTSVAGSLRQALQLATVSSTSTTINFSSNIAGGTISLTNGAFSPLNCLDCSINVDASGGAPVTIDAQGKSNIFVIYNGVNFGWESFSKSTRFLILS